MLYKKVLSFFSLPESDLLEIQSAIDEFDLETQDALDGMVSEVEAERATIDSILENVQSTDSFIEHRSSSTA